MPACAGLLKPRGLGLELLKSTFNAKNFICRLSWSISSHFGSIHSKNVCRSRKSQKITETLTLYLGGSRSFKVIDVDSNKSLSLLLVMISSMSVPICNRFLATRANSGKIITF